MKKKNILITVACMLLIIVLYVVNDKFVFYNFHESTADKTIVLNNSSLNKMDNQLLWFEYNDNKMSLNKNVLMSSEGMKVYTVNNKEEIEAMDVSNKEKRLNENYTGTFLALLPEQRVDLDGDGNKEKVLLSAKTDTILTQGFNYCRTVFESKDIPLEVALSDKNNITIYANGRVLKNKTVNIKSARGLDENYKTDSNGMILNLKIKDLRQGITVSYKAGNNQTYICSYIVESNKLFTPLYFEAQKPMLYCCLLSAVGIAVICIVRKYKYAYA